MQKEQFLEHNSSNRPIEASASSSLGSSSTALYEGKQFASVQEELEYLRSVVQSREHHLASQPESPQREQERAAIIDAEIANYSVQDADRVLHEHYKMPAQEQWEIILDLSPEMHDKRMEGLMQIMQEKGVLNAIQVARGMNSPHIDADFHRFLVVLKTTNDQNYVSKNLWKCCIWRFRIPNHHRNECGSRNQMFFGWLT